LPKTVTRQRRDCDLNPGPTVPECSTLTTRLPSHPENVAKIRRAVPEIRVRTDIHTNMLVIMLRSRYTGGANVAHG